MKEREQRKKNCSILRKFIVSTGVRLFMCIEEIKCTIIPRNCIRPNQKLWLCVKWLLDDVTYAMLYVTFQLDWRAYECAYIFHSFILIYLSKCKHLHAKHLQRKGPKKAVHHTSFSHSYLSRWYTFVNVFINVEFCWSCIKLKGSSQQTEHGIDEIMSFQINFTRFKWLLTCSSLDYFGFPLFFLCSSNTRKWRPLKNFVTAHLINVIALIEKRVKWQLNEIVT